MKKIFLICITLCAINNKTNAQVVTPPATVTPEGVLNPVLAAPTERTSISTPPGPVQKKFIADHPEKRNVTWDVTGNNWRAHYTDNETKAEHIIIYDKNGDLIQEDSEVTGEYPGRIDDYMHKKFPGEKYKIWRTKKQDREFYFVTRNNKDYRFDQNGKYTGKVKHRALKAK